MAIAIADATHENRVFRGNGVVKELDDPVDISVVVNPALGKESGKCVKRGPGDTLQRNVVSEEESVTEGLIIRELLSTREYPPERERRILEELED
jgi:hypothetical protein